MFADRLNATKFFARIRSLDIECPQCATVYQCRGDSRIYNRRNGLFRCRNTACGLTLYLGVLAYPATRSPRQEVTPPDWTPNPRQAAELRSFSGFWAKERRPPQLDRNVVLREGCRCQIAGTGLLVHPACPIHGAGT